MKRAFLYATVTAVAIGIIVGFVLMLRNVHLPEEWERTHWDVRGIVCDLSCYSDSHKRMPPAIIKSADGKPLCSWRFANAAFLLGDEVQFGYYGQVAHLEMPWDSAENARYVSGPYREYMGSPSSYIDRSRPGNKARFVTVQGPGTAFDATKKCSYGDLPAGMILIVETRGSEFHWMEPGGDLEIGAIPRQVGEVGGIGPATEGRREFFVGFVDAAVWLLRSDVPFEEVAKFLTLADAQRNDRNAVLAPYTIRVWK